MTHRLHNKTALITGATSGIGEACARVLADAGVRLILVARDAQKAAALADSLPTETETIILDVRDRRAVEAKLSPLEPDILINNAGLALGLEPLDGGDPDAWETMIDTNLKGLLYVSRAVLPGMRERNRGHIINLGSIAGHTAYPGGNVYCATKAAVRSLSQSMNLDVAGTAIRISDVAPGAVQTNFSHVRFDGDSAKADAVYDGYRPLGADDVADMIFYILNAPAHVNVQEVLIMPTAQRNPFVLHRERESRV